MAKGGGGMGGLMSGLMWGIGLKVIIDVALPMVKGVFSGNARLYEDPRLRYM